MNGEYSEWLAGLKIGDTVFVSASGCVGSRDCISTVERITKTIIGTTGNCRFRRSDGCSPGGGYYHSRLGEPTQERLAGVRKAQLVRTFRHFDWSTLPIKTLETIKRAISQPKSVEGT